MSMIPPLPPESLAGLPRRQSTAQILRGRFSTRAADDPALPGEPQQTLAQRSFAGLAIHVLPTETPWKGDNRLALCIHGVPQDLGQQPATLQLLFCLLEQPSCVHTFEQLCRAMGLCNGNPARDKLTLVEHARRGRILLQKSKLPLHIALVPPWDTPCAGRHAARGHDAGNRRRRSFN